ncbi:DUF433 domain-containing protein [bacterium]|nr:DUF433 domain-containing protein [bacterium]
MSWQGRITRDPDVMMGKPVVAGTRITVELILRKLGNGVTMEQLLHSYPKLQAEDVLAALTYASDAVSLDELVTTA